MLDAVVAQGALGSEPEREKFRQLCRLLGAIYHYHISTSLNGCATTTSISAPTSMPPRAASNPRPRARLQELVETLKGVLHNANFIEIPHDEINRAHREHALVQVDVDAPRDNYREVRFFRRGHHRETIEIPRWFGWRIRRPRSTSMTTSSCW